MDSAVDSNSLELVRIAILAMRTLTDEQRLEVIHQFCKYCGSANRRCYCMMDC